jgi:hypothetical protein
MDCSHQNGMTEAQSWTTVAVALLLGLVLLVLLPCKYLPLQGQSLSQLPQMCLELARK